MIGALRQDEAMAMTHITGDEHADQMSGSDPFAVVVGMMLDQHMR